MTAASATYTVEAYNLSQASENKIHDDTVAQKLGFTGGLVPGVEVFAYMTHPVVAKWGRAWLERGQMQARFLKPLYDGRMAEVSADPGDARDTLALTIESDAVRCASGTASLPAPSTPPALAAYPATLPPTQRPPADDESLAVGRYLATKPAPLTPERHLHYLRDVRERHPIYADEGLAHPGLLLRLCNSLLVENVVLAPWIHTASTVQNFALARVGDDLSARGKVVRNYEHKGHRIVELDAVVIANGQSILTHVHHTAIYQLRHLAKA